MRSGSAAMIGGKTFTATSRCRRVSCARKTSPMFAQLIEDAVWTELFTDHRVLDEEAGSSLSSPNRAPDWDMGVRGLYGVAGADFCRPPPDHLPLEKCHAQGHYTSLVV